MFWSLFKITGVHRMEKYQNFKFNDKANTQLTCAKSNIDKLFLAGNKALLVK